MSGDVDAVFHEGPRPPTPNCIYRQRKEDMEVGCSQNSSQNSFTLSNPFPW